MAGIEEVAQFAVFLGWPIYFFLIYRKMFQRRVAHGAGIRSRKVHDRAPLLRANPAGAPSAS
jgi:hypothetical protein